MIHKRILRPVVIAAALAFGLLLLWAWVGIMRATAGPSFNVNASAIEATGYPFTLMIGDGVTTALLHCTGPNKCTVIRDDTKVSDLLLDQLEELAVAMSKVWNDSLGGTE